VTDRDVHVVLGRVKEVVLRVGGVEATAFGNSVDRIVTVTGRENGVTSVIPRTSGVGVELEGDLTVVVTVFDFGDNPVVLVGAPDGDRSFVGVVHLQRDVGNVTDLLLRRVLGELNITFVGLADVNRVTRGGAGVSHFEVERVLTGIYVVEVSLERSIRDIFGDDSVLVLTVVVVGAHVPEISSRSP